MTRTRHPGLLAILGLLCMVATAFIVGLTWQHAPRRAAVVTVDPPPRILVIPTNQTNIEYIEYVEPPQKGRR